MSERQRQKLQALFNKISSDNSCSWIANALRTPRTKCSKPAPQLTPSQVPVGCKVLPPSKKGGNTDRKKASRATRQNFGQGGNRRYNITTMTKREAERKKREEAAMKEITQVLKQLFKHIDDKHRRSC